MQEEFKKKVKKIVVKSDYELTDVMGDILGSNAGRILLTFTEPSDLLVSPINLRVIQDECDEKEKPLVLQIINNPAGVRNAEEADITHTESPDGVTDDIWESTTQKMVDRLRSKAVRLKKSRISSSNSTPTPQPKEQELPSKIEIPEPTKEESVQEIKPETPQPMEEEVTPPPPPEKSEFTKSVENAIKKSKAAIDRGDIHTITSGSIEVAIGQDISAVRAKVKQKTESKPQSLVGRALSSPPIPNIPDTPVVNTQTPKASPFKTVGSTLQKVKASVGGILKKKGLRKGIAIILIPAITFSVIGLWLAYKLMPFVNAEISITSYPVAVEKQLTGDTSSTQFDLDNSKIRVKKETIEKDLSDNAVATGTGSRGEKAGGLVTLKCFMATSETITAGTTLVADGKNYVLVNDATLNCPAQTNVTVTAAEVGEEYNLPSGTLFSVGSYAQADIVGVNEISAISGGSKEEFLMLAQSDVDGLLNKLKEGAYAEADSSFADKENDGWVLLESSVKHRVDGDPVTDKPVGSETDIFNLTASVVSEALYYNRGDLESSAEDLLISTADSSNLFESSQDLELELHEEVVKEITVTDVGDSTVTVAMKVSGAVVPNVDDNKIVVDLMGKNWEDGLSYLNGLDFTTGDPVTEFTPTWIPERLWYFPTRQGRIVLKVNMVDQVDEVATTESE